MSHDQRNKPFPAQITNPVTLCQTFVEVNTKRSVQATPQNQPRPSFTATPAAISNDVYPKEAAEEGVECIRIPHRRTKSTLKQRTVIWLWLSRG